MTEWYVVLPATILLIALSAFFVIIEFALLAARRNRLEETVETSRSSRAALRSLNELTLMLAGAQLGITMVTFALGAITKPWVHYALMPLLRMGAYTAGYGRCHCVYFVAVYRNVSALGHRRNGSEILGNRASGDGTSNYRDSRTGLH